MSDTKQSPNHLQVHQQKNQAKDKGNDETECKDVTIPLIKDDPNGAAISEKEQSRINGGNALDTIYQTGTTLPSQVTDADGEVMYITYECDRNADEMERDSWGNKIEFILTCVGYAVGLGNVWRFPYLCYKNGGGAFLLPYLTMLTVVGLPLFFLEFAFGQFASLGPISIWTISPLFKGVGYTMVLFSAILSLYYNVIISHCVFYLFASFTTTLPWERCGNPWNTEFCYDNITVMDNVTNYLNETKSAPSEEYYERFVLNKSEGIEDFGLPSWRLTLCLLLAWIIVLCVLLKGIQSLGKTAYFTAIFPYIILTILLIRGLFLKGSLTGIKYYLKPDFERLKDPKVWTEAATQIFFSLSCCNGGLITMSSYNKFKNNCCRDAVLVALLNCGTSVFAGFVIFANLGFMAEVKGSEMKDVAKSGPGLAFVVYPEALTKMPVSPLWSILFFVMMCTLGFGSQFSIVETVLSGFQDELRRIGIMTKPVHKIIFRVVVCLSGFLLGIPMLCRGGMYLLNLLDSTISGYPLLVIALVELIVISYFYGIRQFEKDIKLMISEKPNWYWRATWFVISPAIISLLIISFAINSENLTYDKYVYPDWGNTLSNLVGLFPILFIPGLFLFTYCKEGGWILFREYLKPVKDWGPAKVEHRNEFINMIRSNNSEQGSEIKPDGDDDNGFFQSKLSVASKIGKAAIKETVARGGSGVNLMNYQNQINLTVSSEKLSPNSVVIPVVPPNQNDEKGKKVDPNPPALDKLAFSSQDLDNKK